MSSEEEPVAWLRQRIRERLYLARHAIELGNAAEWTELSSGVLLTVDPDAPQDDRNTWDGVHPMGDSSLTRLMEANDPQDTIARCEAELAILDEHGPLPDCSAEMIAKYRAAGFPEAQIAAMEAMVSCARCHVPVDDSREDEEQCRPVEYPCKTVRLLGYGYRFRPGYREEWKP